MARRLAVGVLLVFAAGCSAGAAAPPTASREPTLPPASPGPLRVVATQPHDQPVTTPWTYATRVADDTFDLHYLEGAPGCDVLADVRVNEAADAVIVTLASARPEGQTACPAIGHPARTRVTLRAPLGTRPLLDGYPTPPKRREVR